MKYVELTNYMIEVSRIRKVCHYGNGSFSGSVLEIAYGDGELIKLNYKDTSSAKAEYKKIKALLIPTPPKGE